MTDEQPQFEHDCENCIFLGSYSDEHYPNADLYYCEQKSWWKPTVICRFSSDPPDYTSGMEAAEFVPALAEAKRRYERNKHMETQHPRAITPDELRDELLDNIRALVSQWARAKDSDHPTIKSKLDGLAFSILALLDGCSSLPAFDLVAKPHPDNKQYNIDNEENWIEDETRVSFMLHEYWYRDQEGGER